MFLSAAACRDLARVLPETPAPDLDMAFVIAPDQESATVTYAVPDLFAENPFGEFLEVTMVHAASGYRAHPIHDADQDIQATWSAACDLIYARQMECLPASVEVAYLVECGHSWHQVTHTVNEVSEGLCNETLDFLAVIPSDGSGVDLDDVEYFFAVDDFDAEALFAMLDYYVSLEGQACGPHDVHGAYVSALEGVTGYKAWSISGPSQSDWSEGYIFTTATEDPEGRMADAVRLHEAWTSGNVFRIHVAHLRLLEGSWVTRGTEFVETCWGYDDAEAALIRADSEPYATPPLCLGSHELASPLHATTGYCPDCNFLFVKPSGIVTSRVPEHFPFH